MILSDREIDQLAHDGMITPYATVEHRPGVISYGVTSYGYDMRVSDAWVETAMPADAVLDPKHPLPRTVAVAGDDPSTYPSGWVEHRADTWELGPGRFVLARSVETFRMPDDVLGIVVGKSTYARCGLIVNCTPMEPAWTGTLTIELHNVSSQPIRIYAWEGIAQVVFYRGHRPAVTYAEKGGKYQHQLGVTTPVVL
jgi:dCTP deaminase